MFGHHWTPGRATVVARRFVTAPGDQAYEYILDVRPDDGSPVFRAMLRHNALDPRCPKEGEEFAVRCHLGKQEVKIDFNALEAAYRAARRQDDVAWEATLNEPPAGQVP